MKKTIGKGIFGAVSLFIFASGAVFLFAPERGAAKLLISPEGVEGLSNFRGFVGAPLIGVSVSLMLAAMTEQLQHARAAVIFLLTLLGARVGSFVIDGPTPNFALYMAVPATAFALMVVAHKLMVAQERPRGVEAAGPSPVR